MTLTFESMTLKTESVRGPIVKNIYVSFGSYPFSTSGAVSIYSHCYLTLTLDL